MKRLYYLFSSTLIISVSCLNASTIISTDSKIVAVTVFQNQAMLKREVTVTLKSGKHQIIISELPVDFIEESVHVSGKSLSDVKILDVKVETIHTSKIQGQTSETLQKKLETLQAQDQLAEDRIAVYNTQKEFIESLKAESAKVINLKMISNAPSIQEWQNMLTFFNTNLTQIYNGIREQNSIRRELANKITAISNEIKEGQIQIQRSYKNITVSVENHDTGEATFLISYLVQNAGWIPIYDARVDGDNKQMELTYYGLVRQSSGEDWEDVMLTLSTAKPLTLQRIPELNPWYLSESRTVFSTPRTRGKKYEPKGIAKLPPFQITSESNYNISPGYGKITGYVKDFETGYPLIGANIVVSGTHYGAATDLNGYFLIPDVSMSKYTIKTNMMGYQSTRSIIQVGSQQEIKLEIALKSSILEAGEAITVFAERPTVQADMTSSMASRPIPKKIKPMTAKPQTIQTSFVFHIPVKSNIPSDNDQHKVTIAIEPLKIAFEYTTIPKLSPKVYLKGKIANQTKYFFLKGPVNVFFNNNFVNKSHLNTIVPSDTFELALGIDDAIQVDRQLINRFVESKGLLGGHTQVTMEYEIRITNNKQTEERVQINDQIPISQHEKIKIKLQEPSEKDIQIDKQNRITWQIQLKPGQSTIIPFKYQVKHPNNMNIIIQ